MATTPATRPARRQRHRPPAIPCRPWPRPCQPRPRPHRRPFQRSRSQTCRYEPSEGESHPRRPRPQSDDQVPVYRPLPCGHGDLSVTQDGSQCRSRQQDHRGDRQGAATTANDRTTAYLCAEELRPVLPRRLSQSERRGLRLRGRLRERTAVRGGTDLSTSSRPIWLGCR